MFSLEVAGTPEDNDLLIAELWAAGSAGIAELDGGRLRAFFEDDADRDAFVERFGAVSWRREEECDWVAVSRSNWEPLQVGTRFLLVPDWRDDPAPEGRFRIVVNPGMAFGTGIHETTQLCMEAVETYVRRGMAVLDVGTGSGILAEAAGLLGASPVWACDIDPVAVGIARGKARPKRFHRIGGGGALGLGRCGIGEHQPGGDRTACAGFAAVPRSRRNGAAERLRAARNRRRAGGIGASRRLNPGDPLQRRLGAAGVHQWAAVNSY